MGGTSLLYLGGSGFKSHMRLLILSDIFDDFSHSHLVDTRLPHKIRLLLSWYMLGLHVTQPLGWLGRNQSPVR